MESVQLTLTVPEINLILESLGQQPFMTVHQLIARIQQQAEAQLEANRNLKPLSNQTGRQKE